MDTTRLQRQTEHQWRIEPHGKMRVPAVIFATEPLIREMDEKVYEQVTNVATLPGIVKASYAMPDAHWGYGFPIGGVAAFDADNGGVISAGGVGFDISCGVRTLLTGLTFEQIQAVKERLADALFHKIPAGVGSRGKLSLNEKEMDSMLLGGAQWAVKQGYGTVHDLQRVEESGCIPDARPDEVSDRAKKRQRDEMGTLGSGNHYLEVQHVAKIIDGGIASSFQNIPRRRRAQYSLRLARPRPSDRDGISDTHGGYRIGIRYRFTGPRARLRAYLLAGWRSLSRRDASSHQLRARQPADPHASGARGVHGDFSASGVPLLYDVSHNTCKVEEHMSTAELDAALRPPQRRDTCLGPGHHEEFTSTATIGTARADRRNHGYCILYIVRDDGRHGPRLRLCVPWGGPQHESASRMSTVARL